MGAGAKSHTDASGIPTSPVLADEVYEVQTIVGKRRGTDGFAEYRVRWKSYRKSDDTWEPEGNIDARKELDIFERAQKKISTRSSSRMDHCAGGIPTLRDHSYSVFPSSAAAAAAAATRAGFGATKLPLLTSYQM